jgi:hypothetical protein
MINEDDANTVMELLDLLSIHLAPSRERVLLDHLYELHRLRDAQIDSGIWDGLVEYQDGMRTVMHPSFTTFLQM